MVHGSLNVIDGCIGQTTSLEYFLPSPRSSLHELRFDQRLQFSTVCHAVIISHESGISFPLRLADFLAEDAEEPVICTADEDIAIGGFESLVWHNRC